MPARGRSCRCGAGTWRCWSRPASSTTLQLEADGNRILVKGQTSKEMVLVATTPEKETYRERLRTTVVALDLDSGEVSDIAA